MQKVFRLVLVWLALLALLAATVAASFLPLGPVLPFVSYAIAGAKAALILWFFMEMRAEGGLVRLAAVAGFAMLAILLVMLAADIGTRGWLAAS